VRPRKQSAQGEVAAHKAPVCAVGRGADITPAGGEEAAWVNGWRAVREGGAALDEEAVREAAVGDEDERAGEADRDDGAGAGLAVLAAAGDEDQRKGDESDGDSSSTEEEETCLHCLADQGSNCCGCRRPMAPGFLFGLVSARDVIGAWNPLNYYCFVGKKYRQRARTCLPAAGHGEEARARKMSRGAAPGRSSRRAGARFRARASRAEQRAGHDWGRERRWEPGAGGAEAEEGAPRAEDHDWKQELDWEIRAASPAR
jgi:hypothetical protein